MHVHGLAQRLVERRLGKQLLDHRFGHNRNGWPGIRIKIEPANVGGQEIPTFNELDPESIDTVFVGEIDRDAS